MAKKNQLTTSDYLEYPEYERLLTALRKDQEYLWELYARIAFCTACRVSDILSIKWKDILNKNTATITEQKTDKTRNIKLNDSVTKKLNELYTLLGSPCVDNYLFQTNRSKGAFTPQYINQKLKLFKCKYRIKIDNFSTHTFRKTFGRYVFEVHNRNAESLMILNKIFNHSSIAITETYIGITKDKIDNIYNSIQF